MAQAMLKACPVCGKMAVEKFRPFCSARCADVDLGRWLGERYRIETTEDRDRESDNPEKDSEE